jgi:hypothetical protein
MPIFLINIGENFRRTMSTYFNSRQTRKYFFLFLQNHHFLMRDNICFLFETKTVNVEAPLFPINRLKLCQELKQNDEMQTPALICTGILGCDERLK